MNTIKGELQRKLNLILNNEIDQATPPVSSVSLDTVSERIDEPPSLEIINTLFVELIKAA